MSPWEWCNNKFPSLREQDKENPSLVFSWDREIPTRGSTVPVGNEASPSFPLNGGPEGWDFPVPLYTNDRFYFSHI